MQLGNKDVYDLQLLQEPMNPLPGKGGRGSYLPCEDQIMENSPTN